MLRDALPRDYPGVRRVRGIYVQDTHTEMKNFRIVIEDSAMSWSWMQGHVGDVKYEESRFDLRRTWCMSFIHLPAKAQGLPNTCWQLSHVSLAT
jgi:hypothetical protein